MSAGCPGGAGPADASGTEPGSRARARLDAIVRGRVQGVGYRVFALREAMALGLSGSVANMADGGVYVVAEGPRRDLEGLVERLAEGPPAGWVDRVETRWEPARGLSGAFRIDPGAHRGD
jgi:acylphosphatase